MDLYLIIALILAVLAVALFIGGRSVRKADHGGVIVEGDNPGLINTGTINTAQKGGGIVTVLNIVSAVLGIIASALVIASLL